MKKFRKFDVRKLRSEQVKNELNHELMTTTEELHYSHSEEMESIWQKIKAAFTNAGEKVLGFRPHRKNQWMSEETWNSKQRMSALIQRLHKTSPRRLQTR